MEITKDHSGLLKIAGFCLSIFFISVTLYAQKSYADKQNPEEMTSLKKLVLGISDTNKTSPESRQALKYVDFEKLVEKEIYLMKWMHTREYWMNNKVDMNENEVLENWMYDKKAWKITDSDLGKTDGVKEEPEIKVAEWMYEEEFHRHNSDQGYTSHLEEWMIDPAYWTMKH